MGFRVCGLEKGARVSGCTVLVFRDVGYRFEKAGGKKVGFRR